MKNNFLKILSEYQLGINKELKAFFLKEIKKSKSPFFTETLKLLEEFSLRPAKRIRAILINYGYFVAGGKDKKNILKTSIFIELIHNFLLIHDDIIDREEFRRGKITLHRQYQKLSKFKKEDLHYGISMAISAGDMIEFLARQILDQSKFPDDKKNKAIEKLNQVLELTAYGQLLELWLRDKFKNKGTIKEKDILDVYEIKTALYTFVGPLQIGGILAGAGQKTLSSFEKIGTPMGIAFQIEDDLQDLFLENASDIKEGQPNLLVIKMLNRKTGLTVKKYLNKKTLNKKEINIIKNIAIKSQAYNDCKNTAENLINQTKKNIIDSNYPKNESNFLINLADYIINKE